MTSIFRHCHQSSRTLINDFVIVIQVRRLMTALSQKVASSKHELTSQEIGNALFGLQGMRANVWETRVLVLQMAVKIQLSHSLIDPQVCFLFIFLFFFIIFYFYFYFFYFFYFLSSASYPLLLLLLLLLLLFLLLPNPFQCIK